eukprot:3708431-Amphidinium_carterae.1
MPISCACVCVYVLLIQKLNGHMWKREVKKTGRLVVTHEAPVTNGFGAEISSKIQDMRTQQW